MPTMTKGFITAIKASNGDFVHIGDKLVVDYEGSIRSVVVDRYGRFLDTQVGGIIPLAKCESIKITVPWDSNEDYPTPQEMKVIREVGDESSNKEESIDILKEVEVLPSFNNVYTDSELIEELRSRGYRGTLSKTITVTL